VLLAIDTATDWASIALYDSESRRILHEETWWARRRHTTTLAPRVDDAVRHAGLSPQDLRGAVVAIGPGSYTGLRVGLALSLRWTFPWLASPRWTSWRIPIGHGRSQCVPLFRPGAPACAGRCTNPGTRLGQWVAAKDTTWMTSPRWLRRLLHAGRLYTSVGN